MTESGLLLGVLGFFVAGWGALWWRLGKMEGKMCDAVREWRSLKRRCPLCTHEEKGD